VWHHPGTHYIADVGGLATLAQEANAKMQHLNIFFHDICTFYVCIATQATKQKRQHPMKCGIILALIMLVMLGACSGPGRK